jgi:hypothetical protein
MIEVEILRIIQDPLGDGIRLNEIADEFRDGRDVSEIMTLLDSSNSRFVSIGAWLLGELSFDLYNSAEYVSRLMELTNHDDPSVRFHALGALFPALDRESAATQALLRKLRADKNEGVRMSAEAASTRLSLIGVEGL